MLKCLIVDDELIARKGIEKYLQRIPFLKLAGSVRTAAEALPYLKSNIDLMVLDIRMPGMTGLDFLKTLSHAPGHNYHNGLPGTCARRFRTGCDGLHRKTAILRTFSEGLRQGKGIYPIEAAKKLRSGR